MQQRKKQLEQLPVRERQVMDAVLQLGRANVAEVLARLENPPSYDTVRTMLRILEGKGLVRHEEAGKQYIYMPTFNPKIARDAAISGLVKTFFGGSIDRAALALLERSDLELPEHELRRLDELIEKKKTKR